VFPLFDLRPRGGWRLEVVHLFAGAWLAGKSLEASWQATSSTAEGVAAGSMTIRVAEGVLRLDELLDNGPSGDARQG